ncbi:unnamed protein product, partial [Owenia fusiformis]
MDNQDNFDNCIRCNLKTNSTKILANTRRLVTDQMMYVLEQNSYKPDKSKKFICNICRIFVWKLYAKMNFQTLAKRPMTATHKRPDVKSGDVGIKTEPFENEVQCQPLTSSNRNDVIENDQKDTDLVVASYDPGGNDIHGKADDDNGDKDLPHGDIRTQFSHDIYDNCIKCNSQTVSGFRRRVTGRMLSVLKKKSFKPDARKKYICNTCVKIVWKLFAKMSFNTTPIFLSIKNKQIVNSNQKQKRKQNRNLNWRPGQETSNDKSLRKKVERALDVKSLNKMHRICDTCKLSVDKVCKALNQQTLLRTKAALHIPDSEEATEPDHTERRKPCEGVDIASTKTVDDNIIVKAKINEQPVVLKVPMAFKMRVYISCKFKDCSFACRHISDVMDHYAKEHVDYKKIIKHFDVLKNTFPYKTRSSVSAASKLDPTRFINTDSICSSSTSVEPCIKDESLDNADLVEISASDGNSSLNMACHSVDDDPSIKSETLIETDVAIIKSEPPCETDVAIIKSEPQCETDDAIIKSEPPCETDVAIIK